MLKNSRQRKLKSRRKLVLPVFLLLVLLFFFAWSQRDKLTIDLNFGEEKMESPIPQNSKIGLFQDILSQKGLAASNIKIEGNEISADISGINVLFIQGENLSKEVVSLQLILSRARIDGRMPEKIDLRFSQPVVLY